MALRLRCSEFHACEKGDVMRSWSLQLAGCAVLAVYALVSGLIRGTVSLPYTERTELPPLEHVKSWGYQLQKVDPQKIAQADIDLVVVDYSRDGSDAMAFSQAEIAQMQQREGGRRLVLAYLSIGEAEDYRYYWQRSWERRPPSWLMAENPQWPGNYPVRFWEPGWQEQILDYLTKIIDAGFDGVYLDRVDIFQNFPKRPTAEQEIISFVGKISQLAATRREDFLVIAQNAESLLRFANYWRLISGIGKEDLLFGLRGDGVRNSEEEVYWSRKYLAEAQGRGMPVLVIEYIDDPGMKADTAQRLRDMGFVPTFAPRALDRLSSPAP